MPLGGEPNYVAGYLLGYQTEWFTAEAGYQFRSTAPQSALDQAITQASQNIAPPPPEKKNQNTMVAQLTDAFSQLSTLEQAVTAGSLNAAQTRQAWSLVARTLKNLIRYAKQDFTSATPPTGPDERKAG